MNRDDITRMAKSAPIKKGIAKLEAELAQAWRDIESLPVVELAARNPSVAEYAKHWEGRATAAEALNEELVEALRDVLSTHPHGEALEKMGNPPRRSILAVRAACAALAKAEGI